MKILVFSDIHGDVKSLERIMAIEADLYFAAGDLVTWARGFDKVAAAMKPKADRVYVIPGNHESPAMIEVFCDSYGFQELHGKSIEVDGVWLAGLGCSSPTPFDTPGEYSEAEFEEMLAPFSGLKPLVAICHSPPKRSKLDRAGEGQHFGSEAIRKFIEREQPAYFFCGHIHEAEGVEERFGATVGINVGKKAYLLDLAQVR